MSFSNRFYVAGFVALCVAVTQLSVTPEASAQNRRGDDGPGGILSPSAMTPDGNLGPPKEKFVELLADKDLSHFRGYKSEEVPSSWSIKGKYLVGDGSGGDIMTKETYEDFELQVEWKVEEGGNSGIMFHVTTDGDHPYMSGPEFQILDDEKHADGKSELTSAGALYGLFPAEGKKMRPIGSWNKSRIKVDDGKIVHYLNSVKVIEIEKGSEDWNKRLGESKFKDWENFAKSDSGHICFQDHGDPIQFRNIRIKRLNVKAEDLAGVGGGPAGADGGTKPKRRRPQPGDDNIGTAPSKGTKGKDGPQGGPGDDLPPGYGDQRGPDGRPPGIGDRKGAGKGETRGGGK